MTLPGAASAATLVVNTTADELSNNGRCSLREAIRAANANSAQGGCPAGSGADRVELPGGTFTLAIGPAGDNASANGDLDVTGPVTLVGAGAPATTINGAAIDRVLEVRPGATATIERLRITGGRSPAGTFGLPGDGTDGGIGENGGPGVGGSGGPGADGGGILNGGTLTLRNASVSVNQTGAGGGGSSGSGGEGGDSANADPGGLGGTAFGGAGGNGGRGGGIFNSGTLTVVDSTVSGNTTGSGGDAQAGFGGPGGNGGPTGGNGGAGGAATGGAGGSGGSGGGIFNDGTLTLTTSTVADNKTGNGGDAQAGFGGLGGFATGGNGAGGIGGAAFGGSGGSGGDGAGVAGTGTLSRSTFSGNQTGRGGAAQAGFGGFGGSGKGSGNGGSGNAGFGGIGGPGGRGGALFASGGTQALSMSTLSANKTGAGGVGSAAFGGSAGTGGEGTGSGGNGGTGFGGAGGAGGTGGGAAGTRIVTNVTLNANSAGGGGAGGNGFGGNPGADGGGGGSAGSTGGAAGGNGGAGGSGGALFSTGGTLTATHATIDANTVGGGGGGGTPGGTGGAAGTGAAAQVGGATLTLASSITTANGCGGPPITDGAGNVRFGNATCPGVTGDPKLAPLANNGGPTRTQRLGSGSIAIDRVAAGGCPPTDQRGATRPTGPACDGGAFEVAPPAAATGAPTAVGATTVTIGGTVDPRGLATTHFIQFGRTTAYGSTTAARASAAAGAFSVTEKLRGLAPRTTYHYRESVESPDGTSVGVDRTFTTARRPAISGLSIRPSTFAVASASTPVNLAQRGRRVPRGTRIRFNLSEDSTVTLTIQRAAKGLRLTRSGRRRCVRATRRNRRTLVRQLRRRLGSRATPRRLARSLRRARCTLYIRRARLRRKGAKGGNTVSFSGRIGRRALATRRYRLEVVATEEGGVRSTPKRVRFRIVKRRR